MSWRDNSSSANRSSTNDGSGGSRSGSGSTSGTGGGGNSNYGFRSTKSGRGNWNTGGRLEGYGNIDRGITPIGQRSAPRAIEQQHSAIPIPPVKPPVPMVQPPVQMWPTVPVPPQQVPAYVHPRSVPVTNYNNTNVPYNPNPPAPQQPAVRSRSPAVAPRNTTTINRRPEGDAFSRSWGIGDKGNRSGGLSGRFAKGGNVDKPSILQRLLARNKHKEAIAAPAKKAAPKKTPWKKGATKPAFAKGGAVEKFMARYPNFKMT